LGESYNLIGGESIDVKDLKDKKIKIIRPMTDEEKKAEGWAEDYHGTTTVIELEDGHYYTLPAMRRGMDLAYYFAQHQTASKYLSADGLKAVTFHFGRKPHTYRRC